MASSFHISLLFVFFRFLLSLNTSFADVLEGTYSKYRNIEYVYQLPPKPVGMIFLAHGCSHSATDWWPQSDSCKTCIGLPVEESLVKESLKRSYLVLAMSSTDRRSKCWSKGDIAPALSLIKHLYATLLNSQYHLPLHLLGASSGGHFVGMLSGAEEKVFDHTGLPVAPTVTSVCVQIMSLRNYENLPPVIFLLMSKDEYTLAAVKHSLLELQQEFETIPHKVMELPDLSVTPTFFYDYGAMSHGDSETLQNAFLSAGLLSPAPDYKQLEDPRKFDRWRQVTSAALPQHVPQHDSLIADHSPISELLNLAWGMHEITDQHVTEVFNWFASHERKTAAAIEI